MLLCSCEQVCPSGILTDVYVLYISSLWFVVVHVKLSWLFKPGLDSPDHVHSDFAVLNKCHLFVKVKWTKGVLLFYNTPQVYWVMWTTLLSKIQKCCLYVRLHKFWEGSRFYLVILSKQIGNILRWYKGNPGNLFYNSQLILPEQSIVFSTWCLWNHTRRDRKSVV